MTHITRIRPLGTLAVLIAIALPVSAQCPQDLCDCLGNLPAFTVLAGKAKFGAGLYTFVGDKTVTGTDVDGSVCVQSLSLRARVDGDGDIFEDVVARAPVGKLAVKAKGFKENGGITPAFALDGDLLTAGGSVKGTNGVDYGLAGTLAIDSNDPRVASCNQAVVDATSASAQFAATTPVQKTFAGLVVDHSLQLTAGAGVSEWVINVNGDLHVTAQDADFGHTLYLKTAVDTDLIILNVSGNVILDHDATITSDAPDQVILNVTGDGSKVVIGKHGTVDIPILAPQAGVLAQADTTVADVWTTRKMNLSGASLSSALICDVPAVPTKTVFVSSDEYDGGTVRSITNADALCQQLADDALLTGTYKAWLSDADSSAASRLSHAVVAYTLADGTPVANDWTDLVDGSLLHAIDEDEDGIALDPDLDNLQVWTGTAADGSTIAGENCINWSSSDFFDEAEIGDATSMSTTWTTGDFTTCDDLARLYCIQQ